jgi:hypothetical protein
MIKVKSGTVGVRDESGAVLLKTSKDPAFSLPAGQEARLVKRGVAVYCNGKDAAAPDGGGAWPGYSDKMKLPELKALAADAYGINAAELRKQPSKAGVIALIEAAKAAAARAGSGGSDGDDGDSGDGDDGNCDDGNCDDGEPPPELYAGGPVA